MKMLADLEFFIREGWLNFTRSRMLTVFSILIIGVSIAIITLFSTVFFNLDQYLRGLEERPVYSIFLTADATGQEARDLAAYLGDIDGVQDVHLIPPDEGLRNLARKFPLAGRIADTLESEPLPYSIRLRIAGGAVAAVQKALASTSIVESIYSPHFFLEELKSVSTAASFFVLVITLILVLASVFTIYNVIRITILARQTDIDIMQLVGADMRYIRSPFTVEGIFQGLAGGGIGSAFGQLAISLIRNRFLDRFEYLPFLSRMESLPPSYLLGLVLLSVALGLIGATLAAARIDYV